MQFSETVQRLTAEAEEKLAPLYKEIDAVSFRNTEKIMDAFRRHRVSDSMFGTSSGYGNNDRGREVLDEIWADVMGAEAAFVRVGIVSGTHALSIGLYGLLRPGDILYTIAGKPYDTLEEVIGLCGETGNGSLRDFGVDYLQTDLNADGSFRAEEIAENLKKHPNIKVVFIQRSKGYLNRKTLSVAEIGEAIKVVRAVRQDVYVVVDNCYGEFVEADEPSDVGADMIVGSLIKNPGGGLAPIGGYICGTARCVERCAYRLSAPGLGQEVGANLGILPAFFQGLFLAPTVVAGALKGAVFAANIYERLGFRVIPTGGEDRHDIIQAVELGSPEGMIAFCRGIQAAAPVDSYVTPEPWPMPGYDANVIMAAGAFVQGSSIELSADGPIRPPYAVYFQGGLTWPHAKLGILMSLQKMCDAGQVQLPAEFA